MASGQQLAEANVSKFASWAASKSDGEFRSMVLRGNLSRTDVAAECGFAVSALRQNPRIKEMLRQLEDSLRERKILPNMVESAESKLITEKSIDLSIREVGRERQAIDAGRLTRLEQENAAQRAEIAELKLRLSKYAVLHEALSESGRIPR